MGFKRVQTLGDVARFGLRLTVTCKGCGRRRDLHASQLYHRFTPSTKLRDIGEHLVCHGNDLEKRGCGHRGAVVDFILPPPPTPPDDGGGGGKIVSIFPRLYGSEAFYDHAAKRRRRRG